MLGLKDKMLRLTARSSHYRSQYWNVVRFQVKKLSVCVCDAVYNLPVTGLVMFEAHMYTSIVYLTRVFLPVIS